MKQEMVINKEVVACLAATPLIGKIHDHAKAIQIRCQTCKTDPKPFAAVFHAAFCKCPTGKEMGDRAHCKLIGFSVAIRRGASYFHSRNLRYGLRKLAAGRGQAST